MAPITSLLAVVLSAAVLAACAGGPDGATPPRDASAGSGAAGAEATPAPTVRATHVPGGNAEALSFSAPDLHGGTVDGSDFVGRDVMLWMWAPW